MTQRVPSPYEVFTEQEALVEAADTKDEARDAIEPILGSLVLYEPDLDAGPETMLRALADKSVLTYDEVKTAYRDVRHDWANTMREEQRESPAGPA